MSAESGGRKSEYPQGDEWLLACAGLRVEGPAGLIGHVIAPVYDFSARWDRPRALAVKGAHGVVEVELEAVERVELREGRILIRTTPR
jgi:hypothetical protein